MKSLRIVRISLASAFLILSVVYIWLSTSAVGGSSAGVHPALSIAYRAQIIPSAIAVCIGAVLFWLVITIFYGRIYCATVCPLGTLIDLCSHMRRFVRRGPRKHYSFRRRTRLPVHILVMYAACLLAGITLVPALIEPWHIMRNIVAAFHPGAPAAVAANLGLGAVTGILAGVVSLLLIAVYAAFAGRDFCNRICPVGAALACVSPDAVYRVEIDPDKCVSCMRCEEQCPAGCVKVVSRYVDDRRCVRCFRCIDHCPNNAIRFQRGRNRAATPLMRRVKTPASK